MGSAFVTIDPLESTYKNIFSDSKPKQVWLQFVPGIVGDVVTNTESTSYEIPDKKPSRRLINSILAKPHYGAKWKRTSALDEEDRYYPMFRGMVDVPMKGDPVLLRGKRRKHTLAVVVVSNKLEDNKIGMNKILRNNLGVRLGDYIKIIPCGD